MVPRGILALWTTFYSTPPAPQSLDAIKICICSATICIILRYWFSASFVQLLHHSFRIADTGSLAKSTSDVLADFRLDSGLNAEVTWTERLSLPRELLVLPDLDHKILAYLHGALDRDQCHIYYQYGLGSLLLHAAVGAPGGKIGTTINAEHEPGWEETVFIKLARLEETDEGMNYLCDSIMLPASQESEAWEEVKEMVPIVIPEGYRRVYVSLLYPADEGRMRYIGGYR